MIKRQNIAKLIESIFLLLMGIQVLLGCVWIFTNMGIVPRFGESAELIQASKDWILDEYIGILYPVFIGAASLLGKVSGIAFCVFIYIVQLIIAFCAYICFLKKVIFANNTGKQKVIYLLSAYIVTFPPVLQCHMSVLPYSLVSSVVLLLVAELKALLTETGVSVTNSLVKICIYWLISALLVPDYCFISGCSVLSGFIVYGWKQRKRIIILLLAAVLTIVCMGTSLTLTQTPGSLGRMQKSAGAVMVSRFAWPYFERNSFFWREEVRELFDTSEWIAISLYPERVMYQFGPKLEAALGRDEANKIYWEMAANSIAIGKKDAVVDLGRNLLSNLTAPLSMQLQLEGKGVSYTGWNYERMKENSQALTKYYVSFAKYAFDFMLFISALLWVLDRYKGHKNTAYSFKVIMILLVAVVSLWYTLIGNGMQDYLKVAPISILWCMCLAYIFKNRCSKE